MNVRTPTVAVSLLLAVGLAGADARAQENFYAGKTVKIIVGTAAGGGQDSYGRLIARYLGRHIPGYPSIIVQNVPGAASLTAVLNLRNGDAPKDGTEITAFNPGLLIQSMTSPDSIKVKFNEFSWLGSIGNDLRICYMWGGTGVKTWDDMMKRSEIVMGDTGAGSTSYVNQRMLQRIFGVKLKQVLGYPGNAEKKLAIERGELDGDCNSWTSAPADWLRDKKINIVLRFQADVSHGLAASVTYAGDLIRNDPDKIKLLNLLNASSEIGRPYILSKDVPLDRLKILRAAFYAAMKDPALLADAGKQKLIVAPLDGAKVEEILEALYQTPRNIVAAAKDISGD